MTGWEVVELLKKFLLTAGLVVVENGKFYFRFSFL